MTGVFDVAQALDGGITDRERAWAFVRGFAAAWGEPLTEDDGTPAAELARAEATLGCSLPAVLREFYTLLGTQASLIANQDPLLPAAEMFVDDECGGSSSSVAKPRAARSGACACATLIRTIRRCSSRHGTAGCRSWTGCLWHASSLY
ncbi:SMI1/KNR4 family protein [Streptomyces sp. NPDC057950]|uniref:SMI1/KNR4 family protein n=1 Tax=Streptomyces sp. NPDC057950 TaxID=3346288 RepID=UPI0036EC13E0